MQNLRSLRGTAKGNVGEALVSSLLRHIHGTKLDSYHWINKLTHLTIPERIYGFLIDNWSTFDAFEFVVISDVVTDVIFYEIKTMNFYYNKGVNYGNKPTLTNNAAKFYTLAQREDFQVKSAWVILYDKWNFEISLKDYFQSDYDIWDGNKKYSIQTSTEQK